MPTDHVLASARKLVSDSLTELRAAVDGLPAEALNWRPSPDTNSMAILVTHTMHSTRLWLTLAMALPLPDRDRDSEFLATEDDPAALIRLVDDYTADCLAALQSADAMDWNAMRQTQGRGGDAQPEVPAAYALIHATEHLRGHVDQATLTRSLWEAR